MLFVYSGTSLFRTSEMQTPSFSGRFAHIQITFPLTAVHYNPGTADTLLVRKAYRLFGPFNTWSVQI